MEGLKIKQKGAAKSIKQEEQVQALSTSQKKYNPDAVSCKCIQDSLSLPSNKKIKLYFKLLKKMQHVTSQQKHQFFLFPPRMKTMMLGL